MDFAVELWEHIKWILFTQYMGIAAAFFVYLAVSRMIKVKEKWRYKGILLFCCWLIISMIIYIGDMFNLTLSIFVFLIGLWISCEGTGMKKLTLGLMFVSTVSAFNGFCDNCVAFIVNYYGVHKLYYDKYSYGRLFFAVGLYLTIRAQKPERDFELSPALWRLMLMLTLSPLGIMVSMILLRSPFRKMQESLPADTVLFLVVILSFAGLLRALSVLEGQQRLERENLLAVENRRYYETMEQQQFEIRRLRHDLFNHLQTLLALPNQQKDEYIRGMLDNPAFGQILAWCGDMTVNAVLTAKDSLMRQKEIRFVAKVDIGEELPFEKADICAIFANALDNAVEGCMRLEEFRREIYLDAKAGKGLLAVNIKNTCRSAENLKGASDGKFLSEKIFAREESGGKAGWESLLPKTTKKDAQKHGFGLRSIQETVKKYGGSMEIKEEEGSFNLFLYLPMMDMVRNGAINKGVKQ